MRVMLLCLLGWARALAVPAPLPARPANFCGIPLLSSFYVPVSRDECAFCHRPRIPEGAIIDTAPRVAFATPLPGQMAPIPSRQYALEVAAPPLPVSPGNPRAGGSRIPLLSSRQRQAPEHINSSTRGAQWHSPPNPVCASDQHRCRVRAQCDAALPPQ